MKNSTKLTHDILSSSNHADFRATAIHTGVGKLLKEHTVLKCLDSGCGAVGSVVPSETRGPRFESHLQQNFLMRIKVQLKRFCNTRASGQCNSRGSRSVEQLKLQKTQFVTWLCDKSRTVKFSQLMKAPSLISVNKL